jgi:hypothetical protein
MVERIAQHFQHHEDEEDRHRRRGNRFVLPMPVWMVFIRRPLGRPNADKTDEVRCRIGERVKPIRQDADRAAPISECDFGQGEAEVQEEDADENTVYRRVPVAADLLGVILQNVSDSTAYFSRTVTGPRTRIDACSHATAGRPVAMAS